VVTVLAAADVVGETTLEETIASAAPDAVGRSLLSVEAVPSWSSSVSSESSEPESRAGPEASFCEVVDLVAACSCFLTAGGGDGEGAEGTSTL
jgi:hypothetical protein